MPLSADPCQCSNLFDKEPGTPILENYLVNDKGWHGIKSDVCLSKNDRVASKYASIMNLCKMYMPKHDIGVTFHP